MYQIQTLVKYGGEGFVVMKYTWETGQKKGSCRAMILRVRSEGMPRGVKAKPENQRFNNVTLVSVIVVKGVRVSYYSVKPGWLKIESS